MLNLFKKINPFWWFLAGVTPFCLLVAAGFFCEGLSADVSGCQVYGFLMIPFLPFFLVFNLLFVVSVILRWRSGASQQTATYVENGELVKGKEGVVRALRVFAIAYPLLYSLAGLVNLFGPDSLIKSSLALIDLLSLLAVPWLGALIFLSMKRVL